MGETTMDETSCTHRKLPPKVGKFEQTNVPFRIVLRDQCMVKKIIEWSLYINNISQWNNVTCLHILILI